MKLILGFACLLLAPSIRADTLPAPRYTITDLGIEPQWNSQTYRKNAGIMLDGVLLRVGPQGQVVGALSRYVPGKPPCHVIFRWRQGRIVSLKSRPITGIQTKDQYEYHISDITAVNDAGDAIVSMPVSDSDFPRPYLWKGNTLRNLGALRGADYGTYGADINEHEEVICVSHTDVLASRAFVWQHGKRRILPLPPGYPYIGGLQFNRRGDLAGTVVRLADAEDNQDQAVIYHHGKISLLSNIPGYPYCVVLAFNNRGDLLLMAEATLNPQGEPLGLRNFFLSSAGKSEKLPLLDKGETFGFDTDFVTAMNASRKVVGYYGRYQNPDQRAFVYHKGQRQDLAALIPVNSGWKLIKACDINDAGQIVGYGKHNSKDSVFLLTPIPRAKM